MQNSEAKDTKAVKTKAATLEKRKDYPRKIIPCPSGPSAEEQGRAYANLITSPEFAAHSLISLTQQKSIADGIDAPTMLETLRDQAKAVQAGDLKHAEAMLMNQATALQALFVRLTERAVEQTYMPHIEGFMRLALRAQSQCRATLETLSAIKNPPIVYAKQANVTTGPQQVNNGTMPSSHAPEKDITPNQQSETAHELLQNTRTPCLESRNDPTLEALGEVHRAKVP